MRVPRLQRVRVLRAELAPCAAREAAVHDQLPYAISGLHRGAAAGAAPMLLLLRAVIILRLDIIIIIALITQAPKAASSRSTNSYLDPVAASCNVLFYLK